VTHTTEAMLDEAAGTFILVATVAVFCMTWFGQYYFTRMTIIATTIRGICIYFPRAGPSLNPMLGTTWAFYKNKSWPMNMEHYMVYWAGPLFGATVAVCLFTLIWAVVSRPSYSKTDQIRDKWEALYTNLTTKVRKKEEEEREFHVHATLCVCVCVCLYFLFCAYTVV
jgi:hypothetical protein